MGNPDTSKICEEASLYYYDYISGQPEDMTDDVKNHIDSCHHCLQEVEWLKQAASECEQDTDLKTLVNLQLSHMELHLSLANEPVTCSKIKALLPIMAIADMEVRVPTPVTMHIDKCAACARDLDILKGSALTQNQLVRISQSFSKRTCCDLKGHLETREVYEAICQIQDRADSEVVTRFEIDGAHQIDSDKAAATEVDQPAQKHSPSIHFGRLLKPLAAAAVIMVGYLLFFNNNSVKATSIEQVYDALKSVKNILMANYVPASETPVQEIWISKTLKAKLIKNRDEFALWDVGRGVKHTGKTGSSEIVTTKVESDLVKAAKRTMNVPWGLLPVNNPANLPIGAVWQEVESDKIDSQLSGIEVYELLWTESVTGGGSSYYKRKYHIDENTKYPLRIEVFSKRQLDGEYELTNVIEISYLSDDQMRTTLQQFGL